MKIRKGFVSNSSSSSYIVWGSSSKRGHIPESAFYMNYNNNFELVLPHKDYTYEFGWEDCAYTGVMDKLNFVTIQAEYIKYNDYRYETWIDMLTSVIQEDFKMTHPEETLDIVFDIDNPKGAFSPYIDHQSSSIEDENIEMFDSEGTLEDFIFNDYTYIQGGNDND